MGDCLSHPLAGGERIRKVNLNTHQKDKLLVSLAEEDRENAGT